MVCPNLMHMVICLDRVVVNRTQELILRRIFAFANMSLTDPHFCPSRGLQYVELQKAERSVFRFLSPPRAKTRSRDESAIYTKYNRGKN